MVESARGDYSSTVTDTRATSPHHLLDRAGPSGRVVLRQDGADPELIVIAGFHGDPLPERLTGPRFTAGESAAGSGTPWRVSSMEGSFEFRARSVDRIQLRPALYRPMHLAFELSATDRIAVRVLLSLLRFPGGARLLRWWQLRRKDVT